MTLFKNLTLKFRIPKKWKVGGKKFYWITKIYIFGLCIKKNNNFLCNRPWPSARGTPGAWKLINYDFLKAKPEATVALVGPVFVCRSLVTHVEK